LIALLVVLAAIGVPAGILQAACVGRSCDEPTKAAPVPFCPLPAALKEGIVNGYRERRSPDVLAVAGSTAVATELGELRMAWPSASSDPRVPLAFWGAGVHAGATIPPGTTLAAVAPTVSDALSFERPNPEVRSGTAIRGVAAPASDPPRLVLLVAWRGVGTADLEGRERAWPFLASLMDKGSGTLEAETGSLPLDPAATITTIGTGALPSEHGITGSWLRNDDGDVVPAFGDDAPVTIVATLADHLEEADARTRIAAVAPDGRARGLVGGGWYPDQAPVRTVLEPSTGIPRAVERFLSSGYGADPTTDVLGVALDGGVRSLDRWTERIVRAAVRAAGGSLLVVVAGTGASATSSASTDEPLVEAVEGVVPGPAAAVEAVVPGGLFLDRDALTAAEVTGQVAVDALDGLTGPAGEPMLSDTFQGFAVSFARYC
jgi:hypothetical protein